MNDNMNIKNKYHVLPVEKQETYEWILKKHYAHRIPCIIYAFGLYNDQKILQGVCTFGPPARMLNDGYGLFGSKIQIKTYELNRLIVNENLPKNTLSFFVSKCLNLLKESCCIVSYADGSCNHHGYIYQATNFYYTGITALETVYIDKRNNKIIHPRTIVSMFGSRKREILPNWILIEKEQKGKYRYLYFIGSKIEKKQMLKDLVLKILPYPKGINKRYDASYKPIVQGRLF